MKGLILKDLYVIWAKQKLLLILPVLFLAIGLIDNNNLSLVIYSGVFIGMLPINLLSTDESEKWTMFCGTLPVSKGQYISGKFVINLIATVAIIAICAISEAVWLALNGGFDLTVYTAIMVGVIATVFLAPAVQFPFIFRFGADKGRILFLAIFLSIGFSYASILNQVQPAVSIFGQINLPLFMLVVAAVYGGSWLLSIRMYEKRTA